MKHNMKIKNLSCTLGKTQILHQLSFTIEEGGVWAVMGPSGSGKTTLLRAIAGFETQLTGTIEYKDTLLYGKHINQPTEKRGIGFVFQDYALFPHLTVQKNIEFGLKSLSKSEREARVYECLSLVDLVEYADRYPHQLSGGQQQRVALARSLAPRPRILLLDEPFSHLDQSLRTGLKKTLFKWLKKHSVTVLWVTHDQKEALSIADGLIILDTGSLLGLGTPFDLYYHPPNQGVAEFLGDLLWIDADHALWSHPYLLNQKAHNVQEETKDSQFGIRPHFWSVDLNTSVDNNQATLSDSSTSLQLDGVIHSFLFEGSSSVLEIKATYLNQDFICTVHTSYPYSWKPEQKVKIKLETHPFMISIND